MPRREGAKPIYYQLPDGHPALATLDAYCAEWDKSRAEASKDIMIAWAKARQGDLSALSGVLGISLVAYAHHPTPTQSGGSQNHNAQEVKRPRSPSKNAQSVDLDL